MRILIYSDSPSVPTGFGTVVRNVFGSLIESGFLKNDDVSFFGVNYTGDPHGMPYRIWPAKVGMNPDPDPYGKLRFIQLILGGQLPSFDLIFFLLDHFSLSMSPPVLINGQQMPFVPAVVTLARSQQGRNPFRVVQYIPVDSETVRPEWVNWIPQFVDHAVAYTAFGQRVLLDTCPALEGKLSVISHGTNPETFFPVPEADRQQMRRQLGVAPDQPLIVNVNRNQPRKDIARTLQVFTHVVKQKPAARLYLHCNAVDSMGFNLDLIRNNLHLSQDHVRFPQNFSEGVGVPLSVLNAIYNAADLVITTARGEGWGLPVSESMTAGRCVLAPQHTAFAEILGDGRGILVEPEEHRQVLLADNDQLRPVADVPAMAKAALWALNHPEERAAIGARAREWALRMTWRQHVVPQWQRLFESLDPTRPKAMPKSARLPFNIGVPG